MENFLVKYVRQEGTRKPIGKIIAVKIDNLEDGKSFWNIGWSLCHKEDEYDSFIATEIALSRALNFSKNPSNFERDIPYIIVKEVEAMFYRSKKYFKGVKPYFSLYDLTKGQVHEKNVKSKNENTFDKPIGFTNK